MASVQELTMRIEKQKEVVLQLAFEARKQTDFFEHEKKLLELDGARDELTDLRHKKCLARCMDCCVNECTSAAIALTKALKSEVFAKLEELEARVSLIELNSYSQVTPENDLGQTVRHLVKGFHEVRATLDAVDNRTRQSNVVIHGVQG